MSAGTVSGTSQGDSTRGLAAGRLGLVGVVFVLVAVAQLLLVALAGTDIPFQDQWDVEGRWLYPAWRSGAFELGDLLRPWNEHRIAWTHSLNLTLFTLNGQWDPLVQLVVIAILRAICAALLVGIVGVTYRRGGQLFTAAIVFVAFLPHLAWHNALWGNQSQVIFALGWSIIAIHWLVEPAPSWKRTALGISAGTAALLAMAPAALVPFALLAVAGLRLIERRHIDQEFLRSALPALFLLGVAWLLRTPAPQHAGLQARSLGHWLHVAADILAWPHPGGAFVAFLLNAPILFSVASRLRRRRTIAAGEDFVLGIAAWAVAIAFATAWARGGGEELHGGVPSRYVDFIVLLPLANIWCAGVIVREAIRRWAPARWLNLGWGAFLFIGWLGLSAEVMRALVLPRARDRDAPVRLARSFQITGDAGVFAGQPRLLVPHPNPESVRAVLHDPAMRGVLPPSLQPETPMGPLSRAARGLLGR